MCGAQERHISLQECLDSSHSSNPDVLNADLDISSARAQKQEAFASWFPTVSATAAGFHALNPLLTVGLGDVLGSSDAAMIKLRSGEKLAKMDLFNAAGMEYSVMGLDRMVLTDGFDSLDAPQNYYKDESEVAGELSESRLLEMDVESKKLQKRMTVGEGLPEVALGASMGYGQVIGSPQANGMVYALVKIPISDWGRTSRRLQRGQNEIDKAENAKAFLEKQLVLNVSKDWVELQGAWDEMQSAKDALALSELLESQKRDEYDSGLCTMSELLQSQTDLQSARSSLVDTQAAYCNALSVWKGEL